MAVNDYIIDFSDNAKATITISPKTFNDTLSIRLFGKGFENYGERLQENILRIMENFARATPPSNATEGQLWYNNVDKKLGVYFDGLWNTLSKQVIVQATAPAGTINPGDLWLNSTTSILYVWNGIQFKGLASADDFDAHVADTNLHITTLERVILNRLVGTTITTAQLARIQSLTSDAQAQINTKFALAGGQLSGYGFVHADPILDNHFANKKYIDDQIYQLATSLNTGSVKYRDVHIHTTYAAPSQSTFTLPQQSGEFAWADVADVHHLVFVQGRKESISNYTLVEDSTSTQVDFGVITFPADSEITVVRIKKRAPGYAATHNGSLVSFHENETPITITSSATTTTVVSKPVGSPTAVGSYKTLVFIDGVQQTPGVAWSETSTDVTILHGVFDTYEYPVNLNVDILILEYDGPSYLSSVEYEAVTTAVNTSIITYTSSYDYNQNDPLNPDNDAILVFITGIFQGVDAYVQNNGTFIKLAEPLSTGTKVETYKLKIVEV